MFQSRRALVEKRTDAAYAYDDMKQPSFELCLEFSFLRSLTEERFCMCIFLFIHVFVCVCVRVYMCVCVCLDASYCVHMYMSVCIQLCITILAHLHVCLHPCVCHVCHDYGFPRRQLET